MTYDFRTVVDPGEYGSAIGVDTRVFLTGSCFSGNIGHKFLEHRFPAMVNPFGVLYNPFSIARVLERVKEQTYCREEELVGHEGLWHHFDFHGRFSNTNQETVCRDINRTINETNSFLESAGFLIITFGTSYVYERIETGEVVANCHKFPSGDFYRYRLEPDEIVSLYKELIVSLRLFNPQLKIIFTVSPVRHWKDGAHGNQLSKSVLHLAIDKLCDLFDKVWYFPAYEILMDELRDYRFYSDDMFNPSALAVDYIWDRFGDSLLTSRARQFATRAKKLAQARQHRFLGADENSHVRFLQNSIELVGDIERQFPEADLKEDRRYFEKLLDRYL
ncbi:MAG: GSCFA domain-containing protein [Marinilabilia sp.]